MELCSGCKDCVLSFLNEYWREIYVLQDTYAEDSTLEKAFHQLRNSQDVFQNRYRCCLCARLWVNVRSRQLKSVDCLMNDAETLDFVQDRWKWYSIPLIFIGPFKQSYNLVELRVADDPSRRNPLEAIGVFRLDFDPLPHEWINEAEFEYRPMNFTERKDLESVEAECHDDSNSSIPKNSVNSLGDERVSLLRSWLENCDRNHECYNRPSTRKKDWLPKRLLKIGKNRSVKLVKGTDLSESNIQYATLSHCWGKGGFETLTRDNVAAAFEDIPESKFGRTFIEAIQLCRQLSIGYLWIDSWCILQDSVDSSDWREQAHEMHLVYGNAYVNIAAAASKCCHDGLLRCGQDSLTKPLKFDFVEGCSLQEIGFINGILLQRLYENSPLFTRGWVMQEILLAARNVLMTDAQIYWKCQKGFIWELDEPTQLRGEDSKTFPRCTDWKHIAGGRPDEHLDSHELDLRWQSVAVDYSITKLSMPEDRLPALAGLTARFESLYREAGTETWFVAGHWYHNFAYWLLWTVESKNEPSRVEERFHGIPSWSWISLPRAVKFCLSLRHKFEYCMKVVSMNFVPEHKELANGRQKLAQLRISAPIFKVMPREARLASEDRFQRDICYFDKKGPEQTYDMYEGDNKKFSTPVGWFITKSRNEYKCVSVFDYEDSHPIATPFECVYVGSWNRQHDRRRMADDYFAIMVQRSEGDSQDDIPRYRRIGMLRISLKYTKASSEVFFHRLVRPFFSPSRMTDREFYLE